jgi:hypothetical protein
MLPYVGRAKELLESAGKGLAITLAAVYATGLLVVTFHLAQYGVLSFSLLRTQYIIAGLFMVVPAMVVLVFVVGAKNDPFTEIDENRKSQSRILSREGAKRSAKAIFNAYTLIALMSGILGTLMSLVVPGVSGPYPQDLIFRHWRLLLWCSAQVLLLAYLSKGLLAATLLVFLKPEQFLRLRHLIATAAVFSLWLAAFLYSAQYFARNLYAKIPYEYGGGRPLSIVLLLKPDASTLIGQALGKGESTQNNPVPCALIMETSDSYIVLTPAKGARAVEIKKDAVYGIGVNPTY